MSTDSNSLVKLIGLILLIGGIGMLFWGYQMSDAFTSKLTEGLTGALPDAVMYRYIGGAISSVAGLFLLLKK
jgi:ABC-type phosphate transport system auxiliary subunit